MLQAWKNVRFNNKKVSKNQVKFHCELKVSFYNCFWCFCQSAIVWHFYLTSKDVIEYSLSVCVRGQVSVLRPLFLLATHKSVEIRFQDWLACLASLSCLACPSCQICACSFPNTTPPSGLKWSMTLLGWDLKVNSLSLYTTLFLCIELPNQQLMYLSSGCTVFLSLNCTKVFFMASIILNSKLIENHYSLSLVGKTLHRRFGV